MHGTLKPTTDTKRSEHFNLTNIVVDLQRNGLFVSHYLGEIASYERDTVGVKRTRAESFAFCKWAIGLSVTQAMQKASNAGLKTGFFETFFNWLDVKGKVSEAETCVRFLLNHNHHPQKIAELIYPIDDTKPETKHIVADFERGKVLCINSAIRASERLNLPSIGLVLQTRKALAEKRITLG